MNVGYLFLTELLIDYYICDFHNWNLDRKSYLKTSLKAKVQINFSKTVT